MKIKLFIKQLDDFESACEFTIAPGQAVQLVFDTNNFLYQFDDSVNKIYGPFVNYYATSQLCLQILNCSIKKYKILKCCKLTNIILNPYICHHIVYIKT